MISRLASLFLLATLVACGGSPATAPAAEVTSSPDRDLTAMTTTPPLSPPTTSPIGLRDCEVLDPPGRCAKIDVGGYDLWIVCRGSGSPTIVLDAGGGDDSRTWNRIIRDVPTISQVCVYDRAGLGSSDPPPQSSRTIQDSVDDLHTLLNNAGISAPYVLVGHSWGGLIAQLYTREHPDDVVGLVLVDSATVNQFVRLDPLVPTPSTGECPELKFWRRSTGPQGPEVLDLDTSIKQVRTAPPFPTNLPLMVLAAGNHYPPTIGCLPHTFLEQVNDQEMALQDELPLLSTNSVYIVAEQSRHYIQQDEPELVIQAIAQVIEAARTQKPLKAS